MPEFVPAAMTPDERRREIAQILARALLRQKAHSLSGPVSESCVQPIENLANKSLVSLDFCAPGASFGSNGKPGEPV